MMPTLSKSQFIRGLQCHKSLWLYRHKPELRTNPDEAQQAVFETGTAVGILARDLFPGGTAVEFEGSTFEEKIARTRELINNGVKTIYEATFAYDGLLVMVDILNRGVDGWELYEVKSSTNVKEVYVNDVTIQYHVLTGSGLSVSKVSLVHVNNRYVRFGEVDIKSLFMVVDLTSQAAVSHEPTKNEISRLQAMVSGDCPGVDIGLHCSDPYPCDFIDHCWSHIPTPSIFDLSRLKSSKKFKLYSQGIVKFGDIPEDYPLNPGQQMQVQAELEGKQFIDTIGIKNFLDKLFYPLYFLDFETFQTAVPLFNGTTPYEQIPFQYSLHALDREDGEVRHYEFLAEAGPDPREELVKSLVNDIPSNACILAFNMTFEKSVIKRLAERFPSYAERLMNIHGRILDLMAPFRSKFYYTNKMNGSYSIKSVLPALFPDMGYDGMDVCNGGEAMQAYAKLLTIEDKDEIAKIRKGLLEYCGLDTLAMVKLLEKLKKTLSKNVRETDEL